MESLVERLAEATDDSNFGQMIEPIFAAALYAYLRARPTYPKPMHPLLPSTAPPNWLGGLERPTEPTTLANFQIQRNARFYEELPDNFFLEDGTTRIFLPTKEAGPDFVQVLEGKERQHLVLAQFKTTAKHQPARVKEDLTKLHPARLYMQKKEGYLILALRLH